MSKTKSKPETAPQEETGGDCNPRLVRLVVCSAICHRETGFLICGARHGDCLNSASRYGNGDQTSETWECGFVDQDGKFMDRREAWTVADAAGQIRRPCGFERHYDDQRAAKVGDSALLFSENLY
jgi:hypothetical protein